MKNKDLILYIHGWNSYKDARKAVLLKNEINSSKNFEVDSITLKSHPKEAIQQLSNYIEDHKRAKKSTPNWKLLRRLLRNFSFRKIQFEGSND